MAGCNQELIPVGQIWIWHHGGVNLLAGQLLVAAPTLGDPNFARAVVLLLRHDDDGATGVILNRRSDQPAATHLPEWSDELEPGAMVFVGGPVEPEMAIGFTRPSRLDDPESGLVNLTDAASGVGPVRVFSGYSGWGPGQLEAELEEGAWMVLSAEEEDLFTDDPDHLWSRVLDRQKLGRTRMLATFPLDLSVN